MKHKRPNIRIILKYAGTKFYFGRFTQWHLVDEKGISIRCCYCKNIANSVDRFKIIKFKGKTKTIVISNIPVCKAHFNHYTWKFGIAQPKDKR